MFSKTSVRSVLLASACILLLVLPAMAALDGFIFVQGARQGAFKGSLKRNGREASRVIEVNSSIEAPRDPHTGLASGKRQHKPIVIVKEVDAASPQYFRALTNHEELSEVVIEFNLRGKSPEKLTLKNAMITGIQKRPNRAGKNQGHETEEITFTYREIEWTWTGGKKTFSDDWKQ